MMGFQPKENKPNKISFFELLCLWYTGRYPKRIIFNKQIYELDNFNHDYANAHNGRYLSTEIADEYMLSGYIKVKCIEILDFDDLG